MRQFTFLLVFWVVSYSSFCQKFSRSLPLVQHERLEFTNFEPTWMIDVFDSTLMRTDYFNGYNSLRQISTMSGEYISNNKYFGCHAISEFDFLGFKVTCVDIPTGDLIWSKIIDTSHFNRQIIPIYQNFDMDGNLVLFGFRKQGPYRNSERAWGFKEPCKMFKLVLDHEDGSILSYSSPDSNENISFSASDGNTDIDFFNFNPIGEVEFLYRKFNAFPLANSYVIAGRIDTVGTLIYNDSLEYSPKDSGIFRSRYAQRGDKYYCLERRAKENAIFMVEMNWELEETSRYKVEYYNNNINTLLAGLYTYTNDHLLFIQTYVENQKNNLRIYMYDYSGTLLKFFEIKDSFSSQHDGLRYEYDEKTKKLIIITRKINRNAQTKVAKCFMNVYLYNGTEYELTKSIEIINDNRTLLPNWRFLKNGENFIFDALASYFYYHDDGMSFPGFRFSLSDNSVALMKVSREDLGLETSQVSQLENSNQFLVYPNPSYGTLHFHNIETEANINIFDIHGQLLISQKLYDGTLDISHLSAGLYILDIKTQDRSERHKIIKID